jgi:hypothetical protein
MIVDFKEHDKKRKSFKIIMLKALIFLLKMEVNIALHLFLI